MKIADQGCMVLLSAEALNGTVQTTIHNSGQQLVLKISVLPNVSVIGLSLALQRPRKSNRSAVIHD